MISKAILIKRGDVKISSCTLSQLTLRHWIRLTPHFGFRRPLKELLQLFHCSLPILFSPPLLLPQGCFIFVLILGSFVSFLLLFPSTDEVGYYSRLISLR